MRLGLVLGLLLTSGWVMGCQADNDKDGIPESQDCDDNNEAVSPSEGEICDGIDNNCDGEIDENLTKTYYQDSDGDGYGLEALTTTACEAPDGYASKIGDCDDFSASISPGADEACDEIDNDCDDDVDEGVTSTFYQDRDGDGYGDEVYSAQLCDLEEGYSVQAGDCDDDAAGVSPNANEICDGVDNDCDGNADGEDAADAATWYLDSDDDGHGNLGAPLVACDQPGGYVADSTDCDDDAAGVSPSAVEYCDEVDNDCDLEVDEDTSADVTSWYGDADGDGYGGDTFVIASCEVPANYVDNSEDCDDFETTTFPGASEYCDGEDDDCDGTIDESTALDVTTWYIDYDNDGYGINNTSLNRTQCDPPENYVDNATDCNDLADDVSPGAEEVCDDNVDNNCDDSATPCSLEGDISEDTADYTIRGNDQNDYFGWSLAVGDFNNDGDPDLLVGAKGVDGSNSDDGAAYLFYGPLDDSSLTADQNADAYFLGSADADNAGYDVAAADVDGDGYDDLLVSSYGLDADYNGVTEDAGATFLIYGSATRFSGDAELSDAAAAWFAGTEADVHFGCQVANAGDMQGDGREELVIGNCVDGAPGAAYLIYGDSSRFSGDYFPEAEIESESDGFASWEGETDNAYAGQALAGAGDFDGDGYDDFLIGAYGHDVKINLSTTYSDAGAAFLIYGDATEHVGALGTENAGAYFYGENAYDYAGIAVSSAGDVNGDGYGDIIIGASNYDRDANSTASGAAYLILGSSTQQLGKLSYDARILGESQYDLFGSGLGAPGDLNDDGYDDVAIGASNEGGNYGATYLFYGPVEGDYFAEESYAKFSGSTAGAGEFGHVIGDQGDLDGDGVLDLTIGARADDGSGQAGSVNIGALYIFTGGGL